MIICDNCNEEVGIADDFEDEIKEYHTLNLNGGKKTFCDDCFYVLSEFACSPEHKKALKEYQKEIQE